jgi:3-hydroxymyristoyl/3-hydroxydecanoyl-(acyl carrier protein) dehydratase
MVSMGTTRLLARRRSYQSRSGPRLYSGALFVRRGAGRIMATPVFDGLTILEEAIDAAGWRARLRVEVSSRAFAGHFEGQPILPGVAFLVIVGHALRAMGGPATSLKALPSVRFRQAVRPGDVLEVAAGRPDAEGLSRFEVKVAGALAVAGVAHAGRHA